MQTRDSHIFLFRESPTKTRRLPLNLSSISVAFNLHEERMNAEEVESQKKEFWVCFNVPRIAQKKNKKIKFALVLMAIGGQKKLCPIQCSLCSSPPTQILSGMVDNLFHQNFQKSRSGLHPNALFTYPKELKSTHFSSQGNPMVLM